MPPALIGQLSSFRAALWRICAKWHRQHNWHKRCILETGG
jgi:hypothetical protein